MAMIACPECGGQVSTKAAACPSCGARPKKHFDPIKAIAWTFMVLLTLFLAVRCGSYIDDTGRIERYGPSRGN